MHIENKKHWSWATVSAIAVVVAVGLGAWWTAVAAYEGEVGSMLLRFGLSIMVGLYYVALHRVATGRPLGIRGITADV